jgi:isoleucyl-tRNA synthetase
MQYLPDTVEKSILAFWNENKIYEKAKAKTEKGKKFYYLDGPPYTSGKVHIGTAWGKSLRDCFLRFKRMNGFNVWDRAGFDTHGLPTELAVEKKLGLKSKDEVPVFGVQKFVDECKKLCRENKEVMVEDFKKLGVWMGFDDPYMTLDTSYIESEWWLIKKAHENKRLYEGKKVMSWCAVCGTALAKHELEYKTVSDDSVFLKFKVKSKDNEFLIIWTTTPWTIPFNLAVMVNPEEDYVKAEVDGEVWVVAAKLAGLFIQGVADKKYKVLSVFKGSELGGLEYVHPLYDELKDVYDDIKKKSKNSFTVVLSEEFVDTGSGSGLVHCAPGCGPEDYEVGRANGIPAFNNLDENGVFPENMSLFKGWIAKTDDKKFIDHFSKKGILIASNPVDHEYAHCWRCKSPVIFRATKQWFFKIEDLKDKMREFNKKIIWQPDWAGSRQFDSWLENLRDNGITRQRYWGCPAPIWRCDSCGKYDVIGSVKELVEKSKKKAPKDLHIPDIDSVKIPCSCGKMMNRIPDILDVWVDAGVASWACLDFPKREDYFNELWPPDFILEGKDQIRGWFNLLFVVSMVAMEKPSYNAVYMHGFINDSQGRKMSKSLQNYILPSEVIDKYGADTLRYYSIGGAEPGLDLNYNHADCSLKMKNLMVFWNLHNFLIDLSNEVSFSFVELKDFWKTDFSVEEKFLFSKLNSSVKKITFLFDSFAINQVPKVAEDLFLSISRDYIQIVREKCSTGTDDEKKIVFYSVFSAYIYCLKIMAPVVPFICEQIWLNFKEVFGLKEESVHLCDWPSFDEKFIDEKVEENFFISGLIIQSSLSAREKAKIGLRWPLDNIKILSSDENVISAVKSMDDVIKRMVNVKNIFVGKSFPEIKEKIVFNKSSLGKDFGVLKDSIVEALENMELKKILNDLKGAGKISVKIDDKCVELSRSHISLENEVPKNLVSSDFKNGCVFLDILQSPALLAEGYAREIMRRTQVLRKKAGLSKKNEISLKIECDEELKNSLIDWMNCIKEKVGAKKIFFVDSLKEGDFEFSSEEKIKEKIVKIAF